MALVATTGWALLAYVVLPYFIHRYERQEAPLRSAMVTRTADGLPGDPLNVGIIGSREELIALFLRAGWYPADALTLRSGLGIVASVFLDRPYNDAPVSPLFFESRKEDLAFEKAVGISADRRQHVRLWNTSAPPASGERSLWLGSASFDVGVGLSHYTGAVTHAISPDIDAMRDTLSADLAETGEICRTYLIEGIGANLHSRNGEGDWYHTDGKLRVSVIGTAGKERTSLDRC